MGFKVFKYVLVYGTSWSNTKLFEFENWSTPGTNSGVFRYIYFSHKALMKIFFHKDEMNKVYTEGDPNLSVSVAYSTVPVFREGQLRSTAQRAVLFWPVPVIFFLKRELFRYKFEIKCCESIYAICFALITVFSFKKRNF